MDAKRMKQFVILSKPFYFGWLLAFPFYGPVFLKLAPFQTYKGIGLITIFMVSHLLTYLLAGLLPRDTKKWDKLMLIGVSITIVANLLLFLPVDFAWPLAMVISGIGASTYILGWSVVYSFSGLTQERMGIMALVIIAGNLVLLAFTVVSAILPKALLLAVNLLSLLAALIILLRADNDLKTQISGNPKKLPLPKRTLLCFSLFAFIIYVNGGFAYRVMVPHFTGVDPLLGTYLPVILYILVLGIIYRFRDSINRNHLASYGVSFIGLAFIGFANLPHNTATYLLTVALMEAAFALIDLFVWISLNSFSYAFNAPYAFFGSVLAANVLSILAGDLISGANLDLQDDVFSIIAMLSATSVLLVILVIPRLLRSIRDALQSITPHKEAEEQQREILSILSHDLDPAKQLTEREEEVLDLLLMGLTNQRIAEELFLSQNTIKTHLRNIYAKLGVSGKRELIYLTNKEKLLQNNETRDADSQ